MNKNNNGSWFRVKIVLQIRPPCIVVSVEVKSLSSVKVASRLYWLRNRNSDDIKKKCHGPILFHLIWSFSGWSKKTLNCVSVHLPVHYVTNARRPRLIVWTSSTQFRLTLNENILFFESMTTFHYQKMFLRTVEFLPWVSSLRSSLKWVPLSILCTETFVWKEKECKCHPLNV